MLTARLHHVQWISSLGLHTLGYREWGDPNNPKVLVCVHGLTRNSEDFNTLAQELAGQFRVVAPDMPGRGRSDWLIDPSLYAVPTYVTACVALIARLNPGSLDWLGTSMGGLIGMAYASLPGNPIKRLILNDVGPSLSFPALERIGQYVGKPLKFMSREEGRAYIRSISEPFGPHSEVQWKALADSVLVEQGTHWTTHYDPNIAHAFKNLSAENTQLHEAALWAAYDNIHADTLVIRGEHSDLLSRQTAQAMSQRGPKPRVIEVAEVGHAPTFMQSDQIQIVRDFLI
jgi:pimeloyl-ACP methyl ester carboxylesterase